MMLELKNTTDEYLGAFYDGRFLNVYCSPGSANGAGNLLGKKQISHPLHLRFEENATKKDLETFLTNDHLKKHRVEEVSLPSCESICVLSNAQTNFMPGFLQKIINKTYLPNIKKINLPNLKFVQNYVQEKIRRYHGFYDEVERIRKGELKLILSSNCNKLRSLDLRKCYSIGSKMWTQINWENANNLTSLDVSDTSIKYKGLKHICKICQNLTEVTFGGYCHEGLVYKEDQLEKDFPSIKFYYRHIFCK